MIPHALIASLLLGLVVAAAAPEPDADRVARRQAYLDLSTSVRMLCIAAAPGEQDAALLAALRHGLGVETSIAFVTSGEAGASAVGPEHGDALRAVRMTECEAAARLLGAKTLYLHLPDFGAPAEAEPVLARWGEEALREGLTRAIRRFRPHLIVVGAARGIAPAGYREAVLHVLPAAVQDAADAKRYDDLLQELLYPWRVRGVFVSCAEEDAAVVVDLNRTGPGASATFAATGARALAQHRSSAASPAPPRPAGVSGFYRPIIGDASWVTDLVGFDQDELELQDEEDFRNAFAVERKIVEAGRAALEMEDRDPAAADRVFEALRALQELSVTPLVSRRLAAGEYLEEKGYQDFFRRRADQLSIAMRHGLGLRVEIDAETKPRAEGMSFAVDVKVSLESDAEVTNVGVRLIESASFVKTYIEQKNRVLTRERPVFAYFKARVKRGAPPTVSPADSYRAVGQFDPGLECEVGGRYRGERFAFVLPVETPPVLPPVELAAGQVSPTGTDTEVTIRFRTHGPLHRFGGRPEDEALRFKLSVAAPGGVRVEPASVVVENRRSGEWSEHRFRVGAVPDRASLTVTARFLRSVRPEILDETEFALRIPWPKPAEDP